MFSVGPVSLPRKQNEEVVHQRFVSLLNKFILTIFDSLFHFTISYISSKKIKKKKKKKRYFYT